MPNVMSGVVYIMYLKFSERKRVEERERIKWLYQSRSRGSISSRRITKDVISEASIAVLVARILDGRYVDDDKRTEITKINSRNVRMERKSLGEVACILTLSLASSRILLSCLFVCSRSMLT